MEVDAKFSPRRSKWFIRWLISLRLNFPVLKIHAGSQSKKKSIASHIFMAVQWPLCAASDLSCSINARYSHRFQTLESRRWDAACGQNITRPINGREKEIGWWPEAANYCHLVSCLFFPEIWLVYIKTFGKLLEKFLSVLFAFHVHTFSDSLRQWTMPCCKQCHNLLHFFLCGWKRKSTQVKHSESVVLPAICFLVWCCSPAGVPSVWSDSFSSTKELPITPSSSIQVVASGCVEPA